MSIFRIGLISVKVIGPRSWVLRYTDPVTRREVKRTLRGMSRRQIETTAAHISQEALANKGYLPGKLARTLRIKDALAKVIRLTNTTDGVRRERARQAGLFIHWLHRHEPYVQTWDQLLG